MVFKKLTGVRRGIALLSLDSHRASKLGVERVLAKEKEELRIYKCLEKAQTFEQKKVLTNLWSRILHRSMSNEQKILLWKFEIAFGLRGNREEKIFMGSERMAES